MYLINLLTSNDISGTSLYNLIWETYDAPYTCANLRIHIVMKEKTMHDLRCIRCLRCKFKVEIFFFINLLFKVYRYTNYTRKQKFPFSKGETVVNCSKLAQYIPYICVYREIYCSRSVNPRCRGWNTHYTTSRNRMSSIKSTIEICEYPMCPDR